MSGPIPAQESPYVLAAEVGRGYWGCACGRSKIQPLCDGSHRRTGLVPVRFSAEIDKQVWLCGCKATGSSPLCDGTHNRL